ncbi:hypothetical protein RvY_16938 [Ramazzottius varieornatus]|uniref:ATP synthase subunit f, mitochondrial n=1 Tax=Ramazzottius varieornatus TaxID=947166 RepID=A0A1D1W0B2_RAMVA|nr:hypothetical protein RvY_16938 [Ramazzottius varieornatus]
MNKFSYFGLGEYPPEYIRRVHGPYDPSRYYGKPDTPFGEVKISELPRWIARRNWSPMAIIRATARGWWRWQRKYVMVRYGTAAPWVQFFVSLSVLFYGINYKSIRLHNRAKYH